MDGEHFLILDTSRRGDIEAQNSECVFSIMI